jgi:hypothetical protein
MSQKDVHHCTGKKMFNKCRTSRLHSLLGDRLRKFQLSGKPGKHKTAGFTNICKLEFSQREEEEVLY